tara:strand:+ start:228 stop:353 length:126 start_codon:yes stop_codon:yes gene_type:complete
MLEQEIKSDKKEQKDPFDDIMGELESYDEGCKPQTLLDSGE